MVSQWEALSVKQSVDLCWGTHLQVTLGRHVQSQAQALAHFRLFAAVCTCSLEIDKICRWLFFNNGKSSNLFQDIIIILWLFWLPHLLPRDLVYKINGFHCTLSKINSPTKYLSNTYIVRIEHIWRIDSEERNTALHVWATGIRTPLLGNET